MSNMGLTPEQVTDTPKVSFILAYYKNPTNIFNIIERIRLCGDDIEIIICNDGKTEVNEINQFLNKPNEYQVCSNNLNELRMYNNGIQLANSDIVIISQDDDIPPDNSNWFIESLTEFIREPTMGVLSLYKGSMSPWYLSDPNVLNDFVSPHREPNLKEGLTYVSWTAFGPWFIRKQAFQQCGQFPLKYSNVGEGGCGGVDAALCAEMWIHDYKVALLNTDSCRQWQRHVGVRNSFRNSEVLYERTNRIIVNEGIYFKDYGNSYDIITEGVNTANEESRIIDQEHIHLFWTGGYDSTFRLCQALLDGKTVQPIYIEYEHLDNLPQKSFKRKNHKQEIWAMKNIRQYIHRKFPDEYKNLKQTIIISNIDIKPHIVTTMEKLWLNGQSHRPMTQLGGLAQVCEDMGQDIEMVLIAHGNLYKMLYPFVRKSKNGYFRLKDSSDQDYWDPNNSVSIEDVQIFKHFLFPQWAYTKEDMLKEAEINNYRDILDLTWSCWFPVNGKPCNYCLSCRIRIIPSSSDEKSGGFSNHEQLTEQLEYWGFFEK
jgi:hypothetical protein